MNGKVQIEDQVEWLQIIGNEEKVKEFDYKFDKVVNEWAKKEIPSIAEESDIEEKPAPKYYGFSTNIFEHSNKGHIA